MHRLRRDLRRDDEGTVSMMLALSLVLLMGMVALVIDLALLRLDRRDDQRTADVAGTAGALALGDGTPIEACRAAVEYVLENQPDAAAPSPTDPCASWPTVRSCPSSGTYSAQTIAAPYTIDVTWPVENSNALMEGRDHLTDGKRCERVGVSVQRVRDLNFAPVMGFDQSTTTADSVARAAVGRNVDQVASLVVLDDSGCEALKARGNGKIHVQENPGWVDPVTGESEDLPGVIAVDSDASAGCTSDTPAIEAEGTDPLIRAGGTDGDTNKSDDLGAIVSYAMQAGSSIAFDPLDVSSGRVSPEPRPGDRITRSIADDEWGLALTSLTNDVGSSGNPLGYSQYSASHPCTVNSAIELTGDWWIDCDPLTVEPGGSLTIKDGNVYTDGPVVVKGTLSMNASSTDPHWLVIRSGDLEKFSGATLSLHGVFVHLRNGRIFLEGSDKGALTWTAPEQDGYDFDKLAMWSESSALHRIAGQASLTLEGVWVAPNANPFEFAGGNSKTATVFQTHAQFITWRFDVSGNGKLVMIPDRARGLEIGMDRLALIR